MYMHAKNVPVSIYKLMRDSYVINTPTIKSLTWANVECLQAVNNYLIIGNVWETLLLCVTI